MCQFERYVGIDYSGAKTPDSRLRGLRVFMMAKGGSDAFEVPSQTSGANKWTRRELSEWLGEILSEKVPTIVGIDHAFSFSQEYFQWHCIPHCWDKFLDDFCDHWPTDQRGASVYQMRRSGDPKIEARSGDISWKRQTEMGNPAKSVFHFDVPGQVATSTHAGLPFLRGLRRSLRDVHYVHFWPFDGWEIPHDTSCIVEAYPRLYVDDYEMDSSFDDDQSDAYATAMWMHDADKKGGLRKALNPYLPDDVKNIASYEGWILGANWPEDVSTKRTRYVEQKTRKNDRGANSGDLKMSHDTSTRNRKAARGETTRPGYINENGQITIRSTGIPGNHYNQKIYQIACSKCGLNYGANGCDIFERKCPGCGDGEAGIPFCNGSSGCFTGAKSCGEMPIGRASMCVARNS